MDPDAIPDPNSPFVNACNCAMAYQFAPAMTCKSDLSGDYCAYCDRQDNGCKCGTIIGAGTSGAYCADAHGNNVNDHSVTC